MVKEKLLRKFFCLFSFDFLDEKPSVQPERERSQSCNFRARPESSETETKDAGFLR